MAAEKALKTIQINDFERMNIFKNCIEINGFLEDDNITSDEKMNDLIDSITEIMNRAGLIKSQKILFVNVIKRWVPTCNVWNSKDISYKSTLFLNNDLALTLDMQDKELYANDVDDLYESLLFEYIDGEEPYIEVS